ncbi:RimJ/RimL family protein N-acetyltransferase [Inhella inkyongensis]|uniref:RimJ/RimL family protein N-acetyltransferase n=1 Tax=Inhella inkyongensis TaxID=392593 RepID=A0A840S7Y3_9BURK|nr:GNAT family N-acetyltransferase [Inhella inkyongensis]MBB5204661.1 RimJ/RimL family protein N-acetyltransferase [Inhella inkyongensis]
MSAPKSANPAGDSPLRTALAALRGNWVPIRSLGRRHRRRILKHLLALGGPDRYLRFGYAASDGQIERYALSLEFGRDELLGVFNRRLELVAMAHLAYTLSGPEADTAEFGVSVLERYRGRGLGSRLFELACLHARNRNMRFLLIHALSENQAMLRIAEKAGAWVEEVAEGSVSARLHLPEDNWRSHAEQALEEGLGELDFRLKHQAKQLQDFVDSVQTEVRDLLGDDAPPPADPPPPP